MSIHIERDGKSIRLNTFITEDVLKYLELAFAFLGKNLEIMINPKTGNSVLVKVDDIYFTVYARDTHIETAFNGRVGDTAQNVIQLLTRWNQFSSEIDTFYVTLQDKETTSFIFENGYIPADEYKYRFKKFNPIITYFSK